MAIIEVEHLTKRYGATVAVDDISFSVQKGEIVGFLGRNGAGKSTTMRMLTGSLGATKGRALVGSFDVAEQPREVKKLIGYLPEVPPLYVDMTVRQYLRFCAKIKGCANPSGAVEEVIGKVGLHDVAHRLIDHLSKGYRQRVGIAQALVHKPPVLVLDEPVSGLDPAQRAEILGLVQKLSEGETTVILSTHVLAEIEPVCDRVIIIHGGKILAQDTVESLQNASGNVRVRVARPSPEVVARVMGISGVVSAEEREGGLLVISGSRDIREDVAKAVVDAGLLEMRAEQGLQDVFLRLTGGEA
jgi:ABC-2 type transport system ATP-binding protein